MRVLRGGINIVEERAQKLNLFSDTEYKIRLVFSLIFFIWSILILWAIASYSGWLPNFSFATRLYRLIGEPLSKSTSAVGTYNLLLFLSLIGVINGLAVLGAVVYRSILQKK